MFGTAYAEEQTWRINVKNADLNEFVMQVAGITGKTFVVDPRIKGNVTVVSSTPMNREAVYELFLSVLRVHNWTAVPSGGVIRIQQNATAKQSPGAEGERGPIAPEKLVTRVISAQNVKSEELVKILRPLIPQYGHIAAVAEPNVVIISDHADNMTRLVQLVQQVDVSDDVQVVVVPMKHAWVGTVVNLLEKVAPRQLAEGTAGPQRVQLIANERNNSLVVRGKPRPVAEILKLVEQLDQQATATGATQVIYLRHGDASKLAPMLEEMIAGEGGKEEEGRGPTTIRADESLNAIVVRGEPALMAEVREILDKLDVRRTQVLIEAAIVEISIDDSTRIGVEMAGVDGEDGTIPFFNTTLDGVVSSLINNVIGDDGMVDVLPALGSATAPTVAVARIDASSFSFAAVVRALATNTNANLLSTPSILTLDNQEAKIVVGNEVPFRTGSYSTTGDGSSNPFTTIQRQDVGLQLTVTPHVHDGTAVRLQVSQEITGIVPEAPIGDAGFSDVVTSKRTIETTVLAEDRQTIVLGGLIQDDINNSIKKVPLLGSIPALGRLFRSDSKSRVKRNLLVFLRPTVIRNDSDAKTITDTKYEDVWEVEIQSSGSVPSDLFRGRP
ncbi:MAG: secretin N-terminal domain-containing protein [Pseudomonadales bacterium]